MKIIPSYGPARTRRTQSVALFAAVLIVFMLVAQLFSYSNFDGTLADTLPINDLTMTTITAALIVLGELLSLPYLLGMYISPLMRVASALMGFLVAGFWLVLTLTNAHAANSGLFSTSFTLPGGIGAAGWSIVLFVAFIMVAFADSRFRHAASS
jgi:hypothetical protein